MQGLTAAGLTGLLPLTAVPAVPACFSCGCPRSIDDASHPPVPRGLVRTGLGVGC